MAPNKNSEKKEEQLIEDPQGGPDSNPKPEAVSSADASLAEQLQKIQAEKQDLMNTLVRRQADYENYRKRVEKEKQSDRHRGIEQFIEKMLPVLDAFEKALATDAGGAAPEYQKGFELIYRQFWDVLSKQGLKRIESAGKEFDPHFHHAIQKVETAKHPEGHVLEELQPGYLFHDRVLRPAMVRVASAPESESVSDLKRRN